MRWPARAPLVLLVACSVVWASTAAEGRPSRPSPAGPPGTVWVTNQTLNTVAAYEARTGELLRTVNVGARPIGVVAPPGSRRASRRSAAT